MTAFSNGYSSDHERAYAALQHWTIRDGEANLAKLINALHRQRRIDVVAKIRWVMEDNPQVGWICRRQFVAHIFFFAFHLQSSLCSVWAWFTEGLRVGKQPKTGVGKLPEFEFMSWLFFLLWSSQTLTLWQWTDHMLERFTITNSFSTPVHWQMDEWMDVIWTWHPSLHPSTSYHCLSCTPGSRVAGAYPICLGVKVGLHPGYVLKFITGPTRRHNHLQTHSRRLTV